MWAQEHGMHRQVTRPTLFFYIKGSGTRDLVVVVAGWLQDGCRVVAGWWYRLQAAEGRMSNGKEGDC